MMRRWVIIPVVTTGRKKGEAKRKHTSGGNQQRTKQWSNGTVARVGFARLRLNAAAAATKS
jgi:hypothetical protein